MYLYVFLFLLFFNKFKLEKKELIIWKFFVFSILIFPLVFKYSTFIDRFIYYLYPLQIIFFTRYYMIFKQDLKFVTTFLTVVIYVLLYAFWIFNATHFNSWFPYNKFIISMKILIVTNSLWNLNNFKKT